jgi:hypothetical protein
LSWGDDRDVDTRLLHKRNIQSGIIVHISEAKSAKSDVVKKCNRSQKSMDRTKLTGSRDRKKVQLLAKSSSLYHFGVSFQSIAPEVTG